MVDMSAFFYVQRAGHFLDDFAKLGTRKFYPRTIFQGMLYLCFLSVNSLVKGSRNREDKELF
jgi:hypothetical protein